MIKVGLIGLGRIADLHALAYKGNIEACIFAVCDSDESTCQKRMTEWGATKYYTDYRQLLTDKDIDAVEILTPQRLHEQMAIDAANAGKHISMQKPMTISLSSADKMLEAVKRNKVLFKVSDNYCFYPPYLFAKKLMESGTIGTPSAVRFKYISGTGGWQVPTSSWEWRMQEAREGRGGATFDHGHHLWALAWFFLGKIERVVSWIDSADGLVDCPAVMMWKYKDGIKYGSCEYVHAMDMDVPSTYYSNDEWIELSGSGGIIFVRRGTGLIKDGPVVSVFNKNGWTHYDDIESDWSAGFIGSTHNFINAIKGTEQPLLSGEEGREILKLALAISKSSVVRREVYVDELDAANPESFTRKQIRKEIKFKREKRTFLSWLFPEKISKDAVRAKDLTIEYINRFDASAIKDKTWKCTVAIHLLPDGNATETKLSVFIDGDKIRYEEGILPEFPNASLQAKAGLWADILLKRKKIEMAYFQGKIKIEGQVQDGLNLKAGLGL